MALPTAASRSIQGLSRGSAVIRLARESVSSVNLKKLPKWLLVNSDMRYYRCPSVHFVTPFGQLQRCALFSTEAPSSNTSVFSSPLEWWRKRQEGQEVEKYKTRIVAMAEKEVWVVGDMVAELDEVVNSWKAKMPGVNSLRETQMAKQMYKTLSGIVKVVGKDASDETLEKMTRKDKLVAALEGETTVEEINTAIDQFRVMALMHRIVRKRKLDGKSIPTTPDGVQAIVQAEAPKMLSKAQKSKMGKEQARKILRRKR